MKKTILIIGLVVVVIAAIILFVILGKNNTDNGGTTKYNKETETYSVESLNGKAKASFEFAKDSGYSFEQKDNNGTFKNSENLSSVELRLVYDYKNSSTITKTEDSFYDESYHDYQKVTIAGYEGWSIIKTTSLMTKYETNLVLTEPDADNKVYALDITVNQSPLNAGQSFNTEEFYNSDDFQHLLNSIKVEVTE